jgi:NAD(P)H-dependent nitrite reductase small subunit
MRDVVSLEARGSNRSAGGRRPRPASRMSGWIAICCLEDIVPDTGVCALVKGRQVAVFRLRDDRVYAIGNEDPFSRANVLSRGIVGDLKGELVVASPVYKQHFSLASGQCLEEPAVRVPIYATRVEDGTVWVRA